MIWRWGCHVTCICSQEILRDVVLYSFNIWLVHILLSEPVLQSSTLNPLDIQVRARIFAQSFWLIETTQKRKHYSRRDLLRDWKLILNLKIVNWKGHYTTRLKYKMSLSFMCLSSIYTYHDYLFRIESNSPSRHRPQSDSICIIARIPQHFWLTDKAMRERGSKTSFSPGGSRWLSMCSSRRVRTFSSPSITINSLLPIYLEVARWGAFQD